MRHKLHINFLLYLVFMVCIGSCKKESGQNLSNPQTKNSTLQKFVQEYCNDKVTKRLESRLVLLEDHQKKNGELKEEEFLRKSSMVSLGEGLYFCCSVHVDAHNCQQSVGMWLGRTELEQNATDKTDQDKYNEIIKAFAMMVKANQLANQQPVKE